MNHTCTIKGSDTVELRDALRTLGECRTPSDLGRVRWLEIVKIEENKGKAAIRISVNGAVLFAKVYWSVSPMQKLKDGVRGVTLGVREARNFERIATCGVNTPELVAYGNSTSWLVPHHSYLIMKEIRPAETLWDYVRRTRDTSIATEAGELLWMIHCHGLVHRDLHSKNILLKQDGNGRRLYVIDMLGVGPSSSQSERIVELVRFLRKHGRVWLNEEAVDLFCLNYYQLGREPVEKYRDYNQFRDIIDKELSKYRSYGET